jgi:hypothetical protein
MIVNSVVVSDVDDNNIEEKEEDAGELWIVTDESGENAAAGETATHRTAARSAITCILDMETSAYCFLIEDWVYRSQKALLSRYRLL